VRGIKRSDESVKKTNQLIFSFTKGNGVGAGESTHDFVRYHKYLDTAGGFLLLTEKTHTPCTESGEGRFRNQFSPGTGVRGVRIMQLEPTSVNNLVLRTREMKGWEKWVGEKNLLGGKP